MTLMHMPFECAFQTAELPEYREIVVKANASGMVPLSALPKPIAGVLRSGMEKVGIKLSDDHPVQAGYYPGSTSDWSFRVLASAETPE